MPIRVEHGSAGAALSLARAAGQGQALQERRRADLALLDFGLRMEAQRDRREAQEQAFSLQLAAAERRARTPMARAEVKSPFADPVQLRVENERAFQAQRRKVMLAENDRMRERGDQSALDHSRNRLRILSDQTPKFPTEPVSLRLFEPRARIKQLQGELGTAQAWAADPDASDEDRQTYVKRVGSLKAQIEEVFASVGQSPTVDPKTGAVAPAARTGPQQTTERLAGQSSEARMQASTAKAGRLFASFPPKVQKALEDRGLDVRELAVWHYQHGNLGHPQLAEVFIAAGARLDGQ